MHFKPIPFLTRRELRELLDSAQPTPDGCLLLLPRTDNPDTSANNVWIRGHQFKATRLVWAELRSEPGDHEVVHVATCPHAEGKNCPVCINVEHLKLGDRLIEQKRRRTA